MAADDVTTNAQSGDAVDHAGAIVQRASDLGVSVLAITDHNHVGGVAAFRAAAEGRGIHIFPGFELSSSEGIHVLCIYAPDTTDDLLARYLGGFGITDTEPSARLADMAFVDILAKVRDQRGVAIAAHVTSNSGLLKILTGQARIRAWRSGDLLAIQIPGSVADLPHDVKQIVENTNSDYRRDPAAEDGLAIAVVNAKDITKPADLDDRSATCRIKMSEVTIEGLRQAFLDPGSRIRLNPREDKLEPEEHAELVVLAWEGGFLDGTAIRFNPNLNVLVGGRGTGKSTVIESIRTVLGLEAIGDEARRAHEGIIRHVLKSGTKISLLVRAQRPAVRGGRWRPWTGRCRGGWRCAGHRPTRREVVVNLIGHTTTQSGLAIRSELDENSYPTGQPVTAEQMESLSLKRDKFHGDWNYSLRVDARIDSIFSATWVRWCSSTWAWRCSV